MQAKWGGASFSVTAWNKNGKKLAAEAFVTRPDGNPDWFIIPRHGGRKAMPVRLLVGEDNGLHKGYGLTHIASARDGDGLWKNISPEKYIADVLTHASELYIIQNGREILVKGKRPSSWMILQLEEKNKYYSIVTAYPVNRPDKKPRGKRVPLHGAKGQEESQLQGVNTSPLPVNAKRDTARLEGEATNEVSLPSPSAGGERAILSEGAGSVNIKDVNLHFDDGREMPASFSVIGPQAKTWMKHLDKAFLGRDDGKMRAEIDANQARLIGAWAASGWEGAG